MHVFYFRLPVCNGIGIPFQNNGATFILPLHLVLKA